MCCLNASERANDYCLLSVHTYEELPINDGQMYVKALNAHTRMLIKRWANTIVVLLLLLLLLLMVFLLA